MFKIMLESRINGGLGWPENFSVELSIKFFKFTAIKKKWQLDLKKLLIEDERKNPNWTLDIRELRTVLKYAYIKKLCVQVVQGVGEADKTALVNGALAAALNTGFSIVSHCFKECETITIDVKPQFELAGLRYEFEGIIEAALGKIAWAVICIYIKKIFRRKSNA